MPPISASPRAGAYERTAVVEEDVWAFVPRPLPPDPPLRISPATDALLMRAAHAVGGLDAVGAFLPDPDLFLYMYVRKEAVLSSQIEGTSASLSDLLLAEHDVVPGAVLEDVRETSAYVRALSQGLEHLRRPGGLPLSSRLLRDMHRTLLSDGRGATRGPGEFRRSQNWIGGTRPGNAAFVPPPWQLVESLMADLERFIHAPGNPFLTAALAHVQLETIHPFLDGNGRIGRMLISLILCDRGLLRTPLLYLSLHLKRHRGRYYDLLGRVRSDGDWEAWIAFFLEGVISTAEGAVATTRRVSHLLDGHRGRLTAGRASPATSRVYEELTRAAVIARVPHVSRRLALAPRTVYSALAQLEEAGIAREITGGRRSRVWVYDEYLRILGEGTEVPA